MITRCQLLSMGAVGEASLLLPCDIFAPMGAGERPATKPFRCALPMRRSASCLVFAHVVCHETQSGLRFVVMLLCVP